MATLQSLLIRIGVDADRVQTGLDRAQGAVGRAGRKIGVAAAVVGTGAGALLSKGLADSLDLQAANSKVSAQLGLSKDDAAAVGKTAGHLFANNFGDSVEQVGEAIRAVKTNISEMRSATGKDLEQITGKVLTLSKTFDQDLGGTTAAVGQMVKTGLAKNATEALDILTVGFQQGNDKAGDLLDTMTEYGTQFRKLGSTGPQAMGLISQGLKAGARDADIVADAIKEFSIRAIDGSDTTAAGFKAIGLNAGKMAKDIGKGGASANKALDLTLDRLRAIPDPVKRSQAAVALFGTQAEDLGGALFALDPSKATQALGATAGAADKAGKALNDNAKSGIESWKRKMDGLLTQAASAPGALGGTAQAAIGIGSAVLPLGSDLGGLALAMGGIGKVVPALVGGFKMAGSAFMWLGRLMMTNPWALLIIAIVVLVVLIVKNWDTIKHAIGVAWDWIKKVTKAAWDWIWGAIKWVVDKLVMIFMNFTLVGLIIKHWDKIKQFTKAAWDGVWSAIMWVVDKIVQAFLNFTGPGLIIKHWDKIKSVTKAAWDWILDKIAAYLHLVLAYFGWLASLPGKVAGWFGSLASAAIRKTQGLVTWLRGLPGRLLRAVGNLGRLLVNAGADIVRGLWNGISSLGGWLYGKILGWVKSVVPAPVLKYLGISSPSKLFTSYGMFVGQGLAAGMIKSSGTVALAAAELAVAADLQPASIRPKAGPRFGRASAGGGSFSSGPSREPARVILEIRGGDAEFRKMVRRWVRLGGGNVQTVLGTGG